MLPLKCSFPALLAFFFLTSSHAQLVLVASESFNYTAGTLNGRNGGTGWDGAWTWTYLSGSSLAVSATGLAYTGLDTSGGSATWSSGGNGISESSRRISLQNSGVVYFQFLSQFGSSSGGGTPNIRFVANSILTGGIGGNGGTYGAFMSILNSELQPASNGSSSSSAALSALNLSVLRIDYGMNQTSLWTNPNLATFDYLNPPTANAAFAGLAPAFDTISIFTRNPGTVDEIKVFSVIPEPVYSSAVAAFLAVMVLKLMRRGKLLPG